MDFDSTIVNTHQAVLDLYRYYTNDYSTNIDDTVEWSMKKVCRLWDEERIQEVFKDPMLFEFMKPLDNAIEVLKDIVERRHYVVISSLHKPEGIPYKIAWIEKHMPFINEVDIKPIYDTSGVLDKSHIRGDVMLDDRPDCLESSACQFKICFGNYSWNQLWSRMRVYDWKEFAILFDEMEGDWYL